MVSRMKAVLISIQPRWCDLIVSGEKTVEIRKTRPKLETPFKVYVYMTKAYDTIFGKGSPKRVCVGGGKIIGEFVCDDIVADKTFGHDTLFKISACMSDADISAYCLNKEIYCWHISNLVIYDEPKELGNFATFCKCFFTGNNCDECEWLLDCRGLELDESDCVCNGLKPLKRPPQSWCYVEEKGNVNEGT